MNKVNMNNFAASQISIQNAASQKAKDAKKTGYVINEKLHGKMTADDVLQSLRDMMPGWTITTDSKDWAEGTRNIEISQATLNKMAKNPKAMEKYKNLILNLKEVAPKMDEWTKENGKAFDLNIGFDSNGNTTASLLLKAMSGAESKAVLTLPNDNPSGWCDLIVQELNKMTLNMLNNPNSKRSWLA